MWEKHSATLRYTVYGILIGVAVAILSAMGSLLPQGLPINLESILQVHMRSSVLWVLGAAPIILGLLAYWIGRRQDRLEELCAKLNQRVAAQDEIIQQMKTVRTGLEQHIAARNQELERRSANLEAAIDMARAATSDPDITRLTNRAVDLIRERFNLYFVGLFLLDETRQWAQLQAGSGEAARSLLARDHRIRLGEGLVGWSIANGRARVALEAETGALRLARQELPETRSEAALPLRSRGEVFGALSLHDRQVGVFQEDTIEALQLVADQLAVALDNTRLAVSHLPFHASGSTDPSAQSRTSSGNIARTHGLEAVQDGPVTGFRRTSQGIFPADAPSDVESPTRWGAEQIALPVRVRNQVLGRVGARKPDGSGSWTAAEVDLLNTLVEQLGVALEDARLYEEAQRRAQRQQLLATVSDKIRRAPDLDSILRVTVQEIRRALGVSHGAIRLGTETHLANGQPTPSHAYGIGATVPRSDAGMPSSGSESEPSDLSGQGQERASAVPPAADTLPLRAGEAGGKPNEHLERDYGHE